MKVDLCRQESDKYVGAPLSVVEKEWEVGGKGRDAGVFIYAVQPALNS